MSFITSKVMQQAEQGRIPDSLISWGIRRLNDIRLKEIPPGNGLLKKEKKLVQDLKNSPIAIHTSEANEQHYELPPEFFTTVLGKRLKYSSCFFPTGTESIDEAEEIMLDLTCKRADLQDGQKILELGCGWGSVTMWMAENYPNAQITAVSNSKDQRCFIESRMKEKGLYNVQVITADMNDFHTDEKFDRAISVEMFEHMRNYDELLRRISTWLEDDGKLFVHIFCHRDYAYPFEIEGELDWMAKYFFTGGLMPADHLYYYFNDDLEIEKQWRVRGTHYERTARLWLEKQDENRDMIMDIFRETYGEGQEVIWFNRWRMFFLACAELFGTSNGREWYVSHYRFAKK